MCDHDDFLKDVEACIRKDMNSKRPADRKQWVMNIIGNPHQYSKDTGFKVPYILDVLDKIKDELDC